MADTSESKKISDREVYYFRKRLKNRVFEEIVKYFAGSAANSEVSKKLIAERLSRDPAQITRWLANPSNLTLETISDLLLAMNAEIRNFDIEELNSRSKKNYAHPLVARALGNQKIEANKEKEGFVKVYTDSTSSSTSRVSAGATTLLSS